MNYSRQLKRLKEREQMLSSKHSGKESQYTYHAGHSLGYVQGQISVLEEIVEDINEASNTQTSKSHS